MCNFISSNSRWLQTHYGNIIAFVSDYVAEFGTAYNHMLYDALCYAAVNMYFIKWSHFIAVCVSEAGHIAMGAAHKCSTYSACANLWKPCEPSMEVVRWLVAA